MPDRPALKFKPRRGNAFHASRQVSENSELFKKLDPGAQFQRERISPAVQLRRSLRGSEAEPTTSSRYSSFRGCEKSLDLGRLRRAARHSRTMFRPSAYADLQPLGLTRSEEKSDSLFVSTLRPPSRIGPSLSAIPWLSRSGISRSPLRVRWMRVRWTIGLALPQSNLERDR